MAWKIKEKIEAEFDGEKIPGIMGAFIVVFVILVGIAVELIEWIGKSAAASFGVLLGAAIFTSYFKIHGI